MKKNLIQCLEHSNTVNVPVGAGAAALCIKLAPMAAAFHRVTAAPLSTQLPVNDLGKAEEDDPSLWATASQWGRPESSLGSWPLAASDLQPLGE